MKPISFDNSGESKTLRSEDAFRRAIESGQISAATLVATIDGMGERYQIAAAEHPVP